MLAQNLSGSEVCRLNQSRPNVVEMDVKPVGAVFDNSSVFRVFLENEK